MNSPAKQTMSAGHRKRSFVSNFPVGEKQLMQPADVRRPIITSRPSPRHRPASSLVSFAITRWLRMRRSRFEIPCFDDRRGGIGMIHGAPVGRPGEAIGHGVALGLLLDPAIGGDPIQRSKRLARGVLVHAADPECASGPDLAVVHAIGDRLGDGRRQVGDRLRPGSNSTTRWRNATQRPSGTGQNCRRPRQNQLSRRPLPRQRIDRFAVDYRRTTGRRLVHPDRRLGDAAA